MRKLLVAVAAMALVGTVAAPAFAGTDEAPDGVRIVNFNVLHGVFCPPDTDGCQASDRMDLLARQLEEADCPEVVGLQEVNKNLAELLDDAIPKVCDGEYEIVFGSHAEGARHRAPAHDPAGRQHEGRQAVRRTSGPRPARP